MKKFDEKLPFILRWLVKTIALNNEKQIIIGDFEEEFALLQSEKGKLKAFKWIITQILISVIPFFRSRLLWSIIMLKNYLKIAFRNIKKQKTYSFINIFGLAGGIACCLLIFLFVRFELSYDKFHKNADRTYRVVLERKYPGRVRTFGLTAIPLAETLFTDFPEVAKAVRLTTIGFGREGSEANIPVTYKEKTILEQDIMFADVSFFDVFSINLLRGNPKTVLEKPNTVVITENIAEKYFGNAKDAIGKILTIQAYRRTMDYMITGISENVPANSHFNYNFLLSYSSFYGKTSRRWTGGWACFTYIVIKEGADPDALEAKLPHLVEKYLKPELEKNENINYDDYIASGNGYRFIMQPLTDIHLKSHIEFELQLNGDVKYVYLFALTAIFILILAFINFVNLTTARAANRAKEIGIRKTFGVYRGQLIKQFLFESTFLSVISFLIAIILAAIILPSYNAVINKNLEIGLFNNLYDISGLIGVSLFIGIVAGSYPAFFLSGFKPVSVLRGELSKGAKGKILRNTLVVFQFTVTVGLITGTFVIKNQIQYMLNRNIGYNKENVLVVENAQELGKQSLSFQNEIKKYEKVISLTGCFAYPGRAFASGAANIIGADNENVISTNSVTFTDDDYMETLGIDLIAGRMFSEEIASDSSAVIINEAAVSALGITNPIGKIILGKTRRMIIGVVRDFNFESLHHKVTPLLMYKISGISPTNIAVRIKSENIPETISFIENKWKSINGNHPFTYSFLDKNIELLYRTEQKVGKLTSFFSFIAVFVGCMGLFGLAAFTSEIRTKEIGIRKVLGASMTNVVVLLSKEYIKIVALSLIIAAPFSYFFLNKWLKNFAYSAKLTVWIFILSGILALAVAFITTSFQTIKSAVCNPVDTLKHE
ncbi:ABC transporter permease [candidate division KSB1 bacterium]